MELVLRFSLVAQTKKILHITLNFYNWLKMMRLCIDIDGTICHLKGNLETYSDVLPIPGAVEQLNRLKAQGFYIILNTARHMKTCEANIGKVIAKEGFTLLEWLARYKFPYDEIWFGKPYADVYIDDKALKFEGCWEKTIKKLQNISITEKL
jgi:capsule biosynthesis phosphatase